jgi:hypothetical protein
MAASPRGPLTIEEEEEKAQSWREERRKNFPTGANVRQKVRRMNTQPFVIETTNGELLSLMKQWDPPLCTKQWSTCDVSSRVSLSRKGFLGFSQAIMYLATSRLTGVCMNSGAYRLFVKKKWNIRYVPAFNRSVSNVGIASNIGTDASATEVDCASQKFCSLSVDTLGLGKKEMHRNCSMSLKILILKNGCTLRQ